MSSYVPLRVRSNFSLLSGASSIESILNRAIAWRLPALAITDENNLCGAVRFFDAARGRGVRPILGALLDAPDGQAVLLAEDLRGYANLCRAVSARQLDRGFTLGVDLPELQEGLVVLTPCPALAGRLAGALERGRLWLELLRPARSQAEEGGRLNAARRLGLGLVASSDAFFTAEDDFELHAALAAMRENRLLDVILPGLEGRRGARLRSPEEMAQLFADEPQSLVNTLRVAERCRFDFRDLTPVFPRLPGDSAARLGAEAESGARLRYGQVAGPVRERLGRELTLIVRRGFADYFLVVADIVRHARSLGTPVAGRGSGAGSLVAYCLGITNVDPLAFGLPFERFLNEGREDFPDLDIDFCWRLRDEVIAYVYRQHGAEHVAMISTVATMQPRLAFREAGKILGLSGPLLTRIGRRSLGREAFDGLNADPARVRAALQLARRLEGFPHHLSVHCGGVVITPGPIAAHAPLQRAEKGVVVTQYDKDAAEVAGLVKLDLLGNRALSSAAEALRLVGRRRRGQPPDPERLPEREAATAALLARGDTVGVNQLESPAMRHLLCQLRPDGPRGLMQVLALVRPGAASLGMKESFVRRSRGLEPVPALDSRLDGLLGGTRGIMLYEDDVLLVAAALTGLGAARADRFRRAVTKCHTDDERLRLSREFLSCAADRGADPELASGLWVQMAKFNAYSFCRAHAASYARLAWVNAWLKANYPGEFWLGALNNNAGMYPAWVYLEEARRAGLAVLLPCVNRSGQEFTLEGGGLRAGLGRIKGLSERAVEAITAEQPFAGLADFLARGGANLMETEALVCCGALDFTGRLRPGLLMELRTSFASARRLPGAHGLFAVEPAPAVTEGLGDYDLVRKVADEWELLELWSRAHPLTALRPALYARGFTASGALPSLIGRQVRLAGLAAAGRRTRATGGRVMGFLTLSDEEGLFETTLFPKVYARSRRALADGGLGPFAVEGRVESQYDAISVTAQRVGPLKGMDCWVKFASERPVTVSRTGSGRSIHPGPRAR